MAAQIAQLGAQEISCSPIRSNVISRSGIKRRTLIGGQTLAGGNLDKLPMGAAFAKGLTLKMGQRVVLQC